MRQQKLTVIVDLKPECVSKLKDALTAAGNDVVGNQLIKFKLSTNTHFSRFVVLEQQSKNRLLFSTCYNGEFAEYMKELVKTVGTGLEEIFSCCADFNRGTWRDADRAGAYVRRHDVGYQVFVTAFPHTSPTDILNNQRIRQTLENLSDDAGLHAVMKSFFPDGLHVPIVNSPVASAVSSAFHELLDRLFVKKRTANSNTIVKTRSDLIDIEDRVVQNQMTIISPNGSLFSRFVLRAVFLFTQIGLLLKGSLSTLPTIHFAQWSMIDEGKNLLFESNYDGTWENYIDDFVDYAFLGLDAIWGQSPVYPPGGSRNIEAFKAVIRNQQYPAQFFYSACPDCTVHNISDDLTLKAAVLKLTSDPAFRRFLSGSHTQIVSSPKHS
jgi:hypothetical protein